MPTYHIEVHTTDGQVATGPDETVTATEFDALRAELRDALKNGTGYIEVCFADDCIGMFPSLAVTAAYLRVTAP